MDQHVNAVEARRSAPDQIGGLLGHRDIRQFYGNPLGTKFLDQRISVSRVFPAVEHDLAAALQYGAGDAKADAARASGNKGGFAVDVIHETCPAFAGECRC